MMDKTGWRRFAALMMLAAALLLPFLGLTPFNTKGEPREAVVALSMLQSDNWVLPVNNGGDVAYKPPLFHWSIALLSEALDNGHVSEYLARLPSALALLAMIAGGYRLYGRRKGWGVALVMGLLTLTNFETHRAGTNCRVDMLLTACMVGALYMLYVAHEQKRAWMYAAAMLCMSGAMLTKGPVGIVLPCAVGLVYELMRGSERPWRTWARYVGLGLGALVLPALWYAAAYAQGGDAFWALVWEENVLRFTGQMSYGSHENPAIYNVIMLLAGMLPYTLLVLMGLAIAPWRRWWNARSGILKPLTTGTWWRQKWQHLRRADGLQLFSALAFVIIFVFYCIPKSKRGVYLLPVYPFVCYFLATYLMTLWQRRSTLVKLFGQVVAALAATASVAAVVLRFVPLPETWLKGSDGAALAALHSAPWTLWSVIGIGLPLGLAIAYFNGSRRTPTAPWTFYGALLLPYSVLLALNCHYQPTLLSGRSDKWVAQKVAERFPAGHVHTYIYMPDYHISSKMHYFTLNFYLADRIRPYEEELPQEGGYVIMGEADYAQHFQPQFGEDFDIRLVTDYHHRSCDTRQNLGLYRFTPHAGSESAATAQKAAAN